jgi:hypothetical protein
MGYEKYFSLMSLDLLFKNNVNYEISKANKDNSEPSTPMRFNLKKPKNFMESVDPQNKVQYEVEWDDLIRLHFLCTSRKVATILEFGVGWSTLIFDSALSINKLLHGDFIRTNIRRAHLFQCYSVDDSRKWIKNAKAKYKTENIKYHYSKNLMSTFNDRICTLYKKLPNICPDLIYLDGPSQFQVKKQIRGISTRSIDRLPMAADILGIEHFLIPGTLIVVDGRTANARFLKSNLQRDWNYLYRKDFDQHFFELIEGPLGRLNEIQIKHNLGQEGNY